MFCGGFLHIFCDWFTYIRKQSGAKDNHLDRAQLGFAKVIPQNAETSGTTELQGMIVADYFYKDTQGYTYIMNTNEFKKVSNMQANQNTNMEADPIYLPANTRIRITADIDMTNVTMYPWRNVVEVDGGRHTISNCVMGDRFGEIGGGLYSGLLADSSDAVIKDLTLHNPTLNVTQYTTHAGAFVAKATNLTLTNCKVTGTLAFKFWHDRWNNASGTELYLGGLCGYASVPEVSQCSINDTKLPAATRTPASYRSSSGAPAASMWRRTTHARAGARMATASSRIPPQRHAHTTRVPRHGRGPLFPLE